MKKTIVLLAIASADLMTVSCVKDQGKGDCCDVLTPMSDNITGRWEAVTSYYMGDTDWVEDPLTGRQAQTFVFNDDAVLTTALTDANGITILSQTEWSVNDTDKLLSMAGYDYTVTKLSATELEFSSATVTVGTGETLTGGFKWVYKRDDNAAPTLAERLVGNWAVERVDVVVDGETAGTEKYGTLVFSAEGSMAFIFSEDDVNEVYWGVDCESGELYTGESRTRLHNAGATVSLQGDDVLIYEMTHSGSTLRLTLSRAEAE